MSDAAVYRCPSCGAPADPRSHSCEFCRAVLQPRRCPWCFQWTDAASRGCPRCGAASVAPASGAKPLSCPTCRRPELDARELGGARLAFCAGCGGVWADAASFKKICEDRATQAAYLGAGSALERPEASDPSAGGVFYRPCAVCGEIMNRFNFAACSGVILDACKPHGVWFDPDELRRIVAFIRGGGLDVARENERRDLELQRKRLADDVEFHAAPGFGAGPLHISSAGGIVGFLLDLNREAR